MAWVGGQRLVLLSLFALILLAATPFACAGPCPTTANPMYNNLYLWVGLAAMLSALVIALAYMVSRALELQMLEAWVKIEMNELVMSVIIAVFCVALIATVDSASGFLAGGSGATSCPDIIWNAQNFICGSWYSDGRSLYLALGEAYFNAAKIASYSYTTGLSVSVVSYSSSSSPASGLYGLVSAIGQAMDAVANFMLLGAAEFSFLSFFRSAAIVMLPLGIFLRSFSFTRKLGGVLLAAVIASAVIYPAGILLANEVYKTFSPDLNLDISHITVTAAENPPTADITCSTTMQLFVQSPLGSLGIGGETGWWITIGVPLCAITAVFGAFDTCMNVVKKVVFTIFFILNATFPIIMWPVLGGYANTMGASDLISGYYTPLAAYALPAIAKFAVLSLVVFLIPLIIAMVMLRNLAVTFGGEPQLYGLSKLV